MAKENLLILYKEDFERTHIWEDICAILSVPLSAESVKVTFTKVEYEYETQDDLYDYSAE